MYESNFYLITLMKHNVFKIITLHEILINKILLQTAGVVQDWVILQILDLEASVVFVNNIIIKMKTLKTEETNCTFIIQSLFFR